MTQTLTILLDRYVLALGIFLICIAAIECLFPDRIYHYWIRWVSHRRFGLHGMALIAFSLPLTIINDPIFGIVILIIGIVAIFIGAFILVYPAKFKTLFLESVREIDPRSIKVYIYSDAAIRMAIGIIFILSYIF